jgi:hypothetical protein
MIVPKKDPKQIENKEDAVLQVQKIYEEENQRDKNLRDRKEIADLKEKLKFLKSQNDELRNTLLDLENKDSQAGKTLEELTSRKAVISLGKNTFTTFAFVP